MLKEYYNLPDYNELLKFLVKNEAEMSFPDIFQGTARIVAILTGSFKV